MSPLVALVLALALGTWLGSTCDVGLVAGPWLLVSGAGTLIVSGRVAWGGHAGAALVLAWPAAFSLGAGLGGIAEARAWAPGGVDLDALEKGDQGRDPTRVAGRLRGDATLSPTGAVTLDMEARRVRWRGRWRDTSMGIRITVGGEHVRPMRATLTRGRWLEMPIASWRRPLPYRNFGVPDAERALARQHLRGFAVVKSGALIVSAPGRLVEEFAARTRAYIREATARHVRDPTAAGVVTAILIGDRSALPATEVARMQRAGIYHVVAISGGNVGIWLALMVVVPRTAGLGARAAALWLAAGLVAFAAIVDGGASVIRAVLVASVAMAAKWWDLRAPATQALAVAAALQLLMDPLALHDPGCLLSFFAAGTLVGVARAWQARTSPAPRARTTWRRAATAVGAVVAATLAIEAMLLPITARWFSVATAAGVLANLAAVPAMAVVQIGGLVLVPAAAVWPPLGDAAALVAEHAVRVLLRSADIVAWAPWLARDVPPPSMPVLVAYYAGLLASAFCLLWRRAHAASCGDCAPTAGPDNAINQQARGPTTWTRAWQPVAGVACALGAATCLGWIVSGGVERSAPAPWTWRAAQQWQTASWPREPWLLITVLDVGQGDATVLRFPSGRTWLIDAGGGLGDAFDVGARVTAPALWALGHRQLSRVIVTHGHPDHAAGVPAVLRRFGARELVTGVAVAGDGLGALLSSTARELAIAERYVSTRDAFVDGLVRVDVLHPDPPDWERRRVRNDDSLVLWVRFGEVGVLLPGDVGQQVEIEAARRIAAAPLTVVKLAHHGSASSTGIVMLQKLRPALALVSAGRANRFGHPADDVVRRVERTPAVLLRTDRGGAIQLATNGRVLLVRTAGGLEGSVTARPTLRVWWLATPPPSDRGSPDRAANPRQQAATPPT